MPGYAEAAELAANLTNKQLGDELAKLGPLNGSKLDALLPQKSDKEQFAKLMALVEQETSKDQQIAYLSQNMQSVVPVIFQVLKHFV